MSPFVNDPDFVLHVGDALEVLGTLPDESVHCVVTSPPYWGLRDYGTGSWEGGDDGCDHLAPLGGGFAASGLTHGPGKPLSAAETERIVRNRQKQYGSECGKCGARRVDHQLGLEPTPEEYVTSMVAVFREVRRVLRRDGTCWLNIGDSYAAGASNGNQRKGRDLGHPDMATPSGWGNREEWGKVATAVSGLKPKDLVGIPWRLAFALQADGWYLRSDIIWSKPNPMPESVTDRPTKAHEYLFLLTRSPRYFYDADAIREPAEWARWGDQTNGKHEGQGSAAGWIGSKSKDELQGKYANPGNRTTNGPRSTERRHETAGFAQRLVSADGGKNRRSVWEIATEPYPDAHFATFPQALVEPCLKAGCPEGGTVLDPFMGSGTVAVVARRLGRRAIGIELNPEYAVLASKRLQQLSLLAA